MNVNYRELLDATIPAEPPPQFDLDALVRRSRSRLRRQRWMTTSAVSVGTIAVLGLIFGSTMESDDSPSRGVGSVSAAATPNAPAGVRPTLAGAAPTEDPDVARARLAGAMRNSVLRAAPGVVLGGHFDVRHLANTSDATADGNWTAPRYGFAASQVITADGHRGVITISLQRRDLSYACRVPLPEGEQSCDQSTGPRGELVIVEHLTDSDAQGTLRRVIVRVERPDGSSIWVISSNQARLADESSTSSHGANPLTYGNTPPLTTDQLIAIGLDPTLTIYP